MVPAGEELGALELIKNITPRTSHIESSKVAICIDNKEY